MGKLHIGTSGWIYRDWTGIFYPAGLPSKDKLRFFAEHLKKYYEVGLPKEVRLQKI